MTVRLLLWDIDGTLVNAAGLGAQAFEAAVIDVVGRLPAAPVSLAGKTDPQIVRDYLKAMDEPEHDGTVLAVLRRLEHHFSASAGELARVGAPCPGAPEVLARLASDHRLINSVLTGNIAPNAVTKLAAFGLDSLVDLEVGAYGSDDPDRNALVPVAMGRVGERLELRLDPDDVWVIGDTPLDFACAQAAGAHCVLVATGRSSLAELGSLGADAVLEDLVDTEGVVKLLTADL